MTDSTGPNQVKPLREVRRDHILHVLRSANGDLERASQILGITVASLRRHIKDYGIYLENEKEEIEP